MALLYDHDLASYDDSHQPTGGVKGFPPHFEFKKLHHILRLVVEGPDNTQQAVNDAVNRALQDGLIAALVAAFVSGGAAAIPAAEAAVVTSLNNSLGNLYNISVKSDSNWVFWWT